MHEPGAVRDLSPLGDPRVVGPQDLAGVGVQRHHLVVGGAHVHHPVVDQRGVLEAARPHRVVGHRKPRPPERPLPGVPLPGELQAGDVLPVHLGKRGVVHRAGIAAPARPFDARGGGVLRLRGSFSRERGKEEQNSKSGHAADYRGVGGWERRSPDRHALAAGQRTAQPHPRPPRRHRPGPPVSSPAPAALRTAHGATPPPPTAAPPTWNAGLQTGTRGAPHRARRNADPQDGALLGAHRNPVSR